MEPSFIRVDADEVTYPAHVILRHKIERALIEGDMTPDDLPAAWNDLMRAMLGVAPPNDALGCLQDIHLVRRRLGLFPDLYPGRDDGGAAFARAEKDRPNLGGDRRRRLFGLLDWLRVNIHGRVAPVHPGTPGDGHRFAPGPGYLQGAPESALSAVLNSDETVSDRRVAVRGRETRLRRAKGWDFALYFDPRRRPGTSSRRRSADRPGPRRRSLRSRNLADPDDGRLPILKDLSFAELAHRIVKPFVGDRVPDADLADICDRAYRDFGRMSRR